MRYTLRFRSLARGDVVRARKWYEREASHMVQAFLDELKSLATSIEENPLMYPKVFNEVRRALMTRFSYAIYFTVGDESIVVLAVTHQARDEKTWKRRVTRRK
ncbi:MAG TPA: type II toxin-antitoxin system RelE/ParE family toxin [Thermoanaerobaculia bacterium]|jgi:plasmid stabilization system protein ParE|nr:type II toxin-antitoxin system RelE/ParE family toxin [Thermoanaerobaculia bacterium]